MGLNFCLAQAVKHSSLPTAGQVHGVSALDEGVADSGHEHRAAAVVG